ncbi:alkaline phosphatase [Aquimarina sp. 2201CG5-10]|uniref:alkaline phosphatase n=1 Tax=Aquimarina callyspongiae TaxID=3098150 RepID=UPI002AB41384|nr:alkaline phosphatase [Aquimarina sp. 2201CG5-10]MDY8137263.1 alkaline phosphatase [Aquimarina sp. 2201CG5-10]
MKNWKKISFLTAVVLVVLVTGILYIFNISISIPSSDIEFSPGDVSNKINSEYPGKKPKNIIIFIADGMGFNHLSLALQTQQSENLSPVWQEFDVKGWHDARSAYGSLTDSEASATAIATGTSTNFGYIGIDKDQKPIKNIFELASSQGYTTGIVTDSYVWDGTPAAFVAHIRNEDDARGILKQIATSELDLLFGEFEDVGEDDVPEVGETLEILEKRFHFLERSLELPGGAKQTSPIAILFEEDEIQDMNSSPNLLQLTETALTYVSSQDKPFVLLVESEEMDAASHENDSKRVLRGLKSIQETLSAVLNFSKTNGETLVIFTADHETGGLAVVSDFDKYPKIQMKWSTKDHSSAVVPLFAKGPGAEYFTNVHRNRDVGYCLKKLISQSASVDVSTLDN